MLGHTVMTRKHSVRLMIHSNYHVSFYLCLVFLVALTLLLKKFTPYPYLTCVINALLSLFVIDLILIFNLLLISFWHSFSNWHLTDILAWRIKIHNAQNWQGWLQKTEGMIQQKFISKLLTLSSWEFLKKTGLVVLRTRLCAGRLQGSNSGKASVFSPLQNFQSGSGTHTASWLVRTVRFRRDHCCLGNLVGRKIFWFFLSGLRMLQQRAKKCIELREDYAE